jgi:hypothetical protein
MNATPSKLKYMQSWSDSLLDAVNNYSQLIGLVAFAVTLVTAYLVYSTQREQGRRANLQSQSTSNELRATKDALSEQAQRNEALEAKLRPKPLDQRLREFLNSLEDIGPKLLQALATSSDNYPLFRVEMVLDKATQFKRLCAEDESQRFVTLVPLEQTDSIMIAKDNGMVVTDVRFRLNKALLPK